MLEMHGALVIFLTLTIAWFAATLPPGEMWWPSPNETHNCTKILEQTVPGRYVLPAGHYAIPDRGYITPDRHYVILDHEHIMLGQ
ncbi:hypothetical protein GE061_012680 [Apolygus lucorum]|uniref:Uncharacterized protein n=1 Tax=Apolygus lucorum TaxID=248454 RepID=A0A8S9XUA5_APOLU|nr:hypothetical protein GE061_012680 [Apolygus lucorum]